MPPVRPAVSRRGLGAVPDRTTHRASGACSSRALPRRVRPAFPHTLRRDARGSCSKPCSRERVRHGRMSPERRGDHRSVPRCRRAPRSRAIGSRRRVRLRWIPCGRRTRHHGTVNSRNRWVGVGAPRHGSSRRPTSIARCPRDGSLGRPASGGRCHDRPPTPGHPTRPPSRSRYRPRRCGQRGDRRQSIASRVRLRRRVVWAHRDTTACAVIVAAVP